MSGEKEKVSRITIIMGPIMILIVGGIFCLLYYFAIYQEFRYRGVWPESTGEIIAFQKIKGRGASPLWPMCDLKIQYNSASNKVEVFDANLKPVFYCNKGQKVRLLLPPDNGEPILLSSNTYYWLIEIFWFEAPFLAFIVGFLFYLPREVYYEYKKLFKQRKA